VFYHDTHIIPTTDRQQSTGLSYKFFQVQQQNSKIFPVFPGVIAAVDTMVVKAGKSPLPGGR